MNSLNRIKALSSMVLLFVGLVFSSLALAETAVIVHPSNGAALTDSDIQRLFLGKQKSFPGGAEAIPIDQDVGSPARDAFFSTVLSKSEQQLKAYWSRLVFTGKGRPPKVVGDSAAVKDLVAKNPSLIGYVDSSAVDDSVKVVHTF